MGYTKAEYIAQPQVREFIKWIKPFLNEPSPENKEPFHSYTATRPKKDYTFSSIYDAYAQYFWKRKNINDTFKKLNNLREKLLESLAGNDLKEQGSEQLCLNTCNDILAWGGVSRGNKSRLQNICTNESIISYFNNARTILMENRKSDEYYDGTFHMNAGFSKIYALCIDDFIIYDSRVAAALTMLVQRYVKDKGAYVEDISGLEFCVPASRGNSNRRTICARNTIHTPNQYVENNVRANWLLAEILEQAADSPFNNNKSRNERLRALEAALFMIGYDVRPHVGK